MDAAILAAALGAVRVGEIWLGDCFACKARGALTIRPAAGAAAEDGGGEGRPPGPPPLLLSCSACSVPETLAAAIASGLLRQAHTLASESVDALLARDEPLAPQLLAPWLPPTGSGLIQGGRGTGKTWVALGIAWAVATGGQFAGWQAPQPRRVLLVDGESPTSVLQARLRALIAGGGSTPPHPEFARIIAADTLPDGIPDLATAAGQTALEPHLDGADLVVLDDLSTLCGQAQGSGGRPAGLRDWLLRRRRRGQAVILFERIGAGMASAASDPATAAVFDTIATLRHPAHRHATVGTRTIVGFAKARAARNGLPPPLAIEIALADGAAHWAASLPPASAADRAAALHAAGWTQRRIAGALGLSQATVSRALSQHRVNNASTSRNALTRYGDRPDRGYSHE